MKKVFFILFFVLFLFFGCSGGKKANEIEQNDVERGDFDAPETTDGDFDSVGDFDVPETIDDDFDSVGDFDAPETMDDDFDSVGDFDVPETTDGDFAGDFCGDGKIQRSTLENCWDLPLCDGETTTNCCEIIEGAREFCDDGANNGAPDSCASDCATLSTPYLDSATGLVWSAKSEERMYWDEAKKYCKNLREGGLTDWRLPSISELRTLIRNCPGTVTGGSCGITDECLSFNDCWTEVDCWDCLEDNNGKYSLFGDSDWLWSSSPDTDNPGSAWYIYFDYGYVLPTIYPDYSSAVRCVTKR